MGKIFSLIARLSLPEPCKQVIMDEISNDFNIHHNLNKIKYVGLISRLVHYTLFKVTFTSFGDLPRDVAISKGENVLQLSRHFLVCMRMYHPHCGSSKIPEHGLSTYPSRSSTPPQEIRLS